MPFLFGGYFYFPEGRYPEPPRSNPGSRNGMGCLIGKLVCNWFARESKRNGQDEKRLTDIPDLGGSSF